MVTFYKNYNLTKLDGLNNSNYLLEYKINKYVLRIPKKDNKNDFSKENSILNLVSFSKLSPLIIYHNKSNGLLISKFLEDSKISINTFNSFKFIHSLAPRLKKLHSLECEHFFDPFKVIEYNINFLKDKNFDFKHDIKKLLDKLNILKLKLEKDIHYGLCHNDLNSSNILYHKEKVYFIDFEFSGMGDIFFDLATLSWLLDKDSKIELITTYFGYYTSYLEEKTNDYLFVVKLWNATWSFIKSLNSISDYDYKLGGNMILDDLISSL